MPAPRQSAVIRAALAGYYGFGNAGDEMILRCLAENVQGVSWTVLSRCLDAAAKKPLASRQADRGVETCDRWSLMALSRVFRRSQWLVLGGGELFQSSTGFLSLLYYLFLPVWARLWGCRFVAFGMGIDPGLGRLGRGLVRRVLGLAEKVWVRDSASAGLLAARKSGRPIAVMPDPVWAWPVGAGKKPEAFRRLLWILRPTDSPDGVPGAWIGALNDLSGTTGFSHGFLALHRELDEPFLAEIRAGLRFFHGLEAWDALEDIPSIIGKYDLVVSMRFHGVLLAGLCGRPCVAVAGHGKVAQLAQELGWPVLSLGERGAEAFGAAFKKAWGGDLAGPPRLPPDSALQERVRAARQALKELEQGLVQARPNI